MPKEQSLGKKPTSRRYSPEEKAAAVRMVRALRAELGTEQGTVARVAGQLRLWRGGGLSGEGVQERWIVPNEKISGSSR